MGAAMKLAPQRLSVLDLAEVLGNVSPACGRRWITRSQFYEYKYRFQTAGLEGMKDLPPSGNPDPVTVSLCFPNAVVCLVSALAWHDLTTQVRHVVSVALPRNSQLGSVRSMVERRKGA